MSKGKKLIRNLAILIILVFLFMRINGLHLSSKSAYERTERSLHYGPSEVIHIEDIDNGKLILGKYDRWVSCSYINRELLLFWNVRNPSIGLEKDQSQVINFNAGSTEGTIYFYGFINDEAVDRIELRLGNGEIYEEKEFYDDLFLILAETDEETASTLDLREIKSYDEDGNVIFEYKFY